MFPRTHRVALDWLSKSILKFLTPKTNSQTCLPRGISHVTNGIIFCVCLTLAISVLQIVLKWCRKERKKIQVKKESQQNRSRWWIWSRDAANGLLMCYLLLHQKARGKPDMKVNFLWARKLSSIMERSDLLYTLTHQATQNGMLIKLGLLKSGNLMNWWMIEQTRPVATAQHTDRFIVEHDKMNSYTEAESDLSLGSRSFLHRVNDQVRKRQKQSSLDATEDSEEHSVIWRMFMSSTSQASVFMGKNYSDNWHSTKISQWNRCSTYLKNWCPNNQTRSMEWRQLTGKTLHGSICLWLVMNKSSVFSAQKSTYFLILYCVWVRYTRTLPQTPHGKKD